MKTERDTFDEWYKSEYPLDYEHYVNEQDIGLFTKLYLRCFASWQASANREGYKLVPVEPTYEMWSELSRHLGRYMQMHNRYCPKTLKKYFDRFIGEPPEWLSKEVGSWDSDHAFATADLPVFIYKAMIEAA